MQHSPRTCDAGGAVASLARTLSLALALAGLTTPLTASGTPADRPGERGAITRAAPLSPAAAARLARNRVDPRAVDVSLLNAEPDPSGRWLALRAERQRPHQLALWFVDLGNGQFHRFEDGEPTAAPMAWREGELVVEVRRSGRRQVLSIDPGSGSFEALGRGAAPGQAWSGASIARC